MPRSPRIWFPGAWYHIIARGNNRELIFFADRDYLRYLRLLKEALRKHEANVHAYVLMPNHIHLMMETGQHHSIAAIMQWLHDLHRIHQPQARSRRPSVPGTLPKHPN